MRNVDSGLESRVLAKVRSREPASPHTYAKAQPKHVTAIRNSVLARWCSSRGEIISIPKLTPTEARVMAYLVDKMAQSAQGADAGYVAEDLEWLICSLYGLTDEERAEVTFSSRDDRPPLTEEEEDAAMLRAIHQAETWEQDDEFIKHEEIMRKLLGRDGC